MAYHATVVPPTTGSAMTAAYLSDFINTTVSTNTLIQILENGPLLILIWKD